MNPNTKYALYQFLSVFAFTILWDLFKERPVEIIVNLVVAFLLAIITRGILYVVTKESAYPKEG